MKAIIEVDVPDYQIGQEVSIYFKDTMRIKGVVQEPSGDLISRQAVKDWFCTNYCSEHNKCEHFEKGDCNAMIELFAIPPVKQEPCIDTVSRQAVLDVEYQIKIINDIEYVMLSEVQMKMRKLPSVRPKQKTGHWIDDGRYAEGHSEHAYRCSECGEHYIGYVGEYKHCPNCGTRMESEE